VIQLFVEIGSNPIEEFKMERRGFALPTVLGILFILLVLGTIVSLAVVKTTENYTMSKDAVVALHAAESGVEEALVKLNNGSITSFPYTFTGSLNGATYQVEVTQTSTGYLIRSTGQKGRASRFVEVAVKPGGGVFYPFSINGKFDITDMDSTAWTDAEMAVVDIDNEDKELLEEAGFEVNQFSFLDLPKVSEIDESKIFDPLDNSNCDVGNPLMDIFITSANASFLEGKVVCGRNVIIASDIDVDNLFVLAEEDIYVNGEISDKGRKDNWEVTLAAKDKVIFNDKIKFTGKTDGGYNLLVYGGEAIEADRFSQGIITVTGNQDASKVSSIFFLTPGYICSESTFLWDTGSTKKGVNFVIWADEGVNISDRDSIHLTGSVPDGYERNFAFIVADGDVFMNKLNFKRNTHPSGLTYEEIKDFCENGDTLDIPDFYKNLFCELKRQIDNGGGGGLTVVSWKVD